MKGYNVITGLYTTRYYCLKYNPGCVAVKVDGGYKPMTSNEYKIWGKQK